MSGAFASSCRRYGAGPYRLAVVHGGPGGIGSAGDLAAELARRCGAGVWEPLQGAYSVCALADELASQLAAPEVAEKVTLIGHSWGAWLAGMYASRHPWKVARLILIGTPPLNAEINVDALRRMRFAPSARAEYDRLLGELAASSPDSREALMRGLGRLCEKADAFDLLPPDAAAPPAFFDGRMFETVWREAAAMRVRGDWERLFAELAVPVTLIHGDCDPHPADAVKHFFESHSRVCAFHLLERCGHTPWRERYAREAFYGLLAEACA